MSDDVDEWRKRHHFGEIQKNTIPEKHKKLKGVRSQIVEWVEYQSFKSRQEIKTTVQSTSPVSDHRECHWKIAQIEYITHWSKLIFQLFHTSMSIRHVQNHT